MTAFTSSSVWPGFNACVGCQHDSLSAACSSYLRATEVLLQHVIEKEADLDGLVLPILFNWRHYLELRCKTICVDGAVIAGDVAALDKSHDLRRLWRVARAHLVAVFPEEARDDVLSPIDAHIEELGDIDPRAMTFRYTVDLGHKSLLPPRLRHVAYAELLETIERVSSLLEGADVMMGQARDFACERMTTDFDRW